ncbi:hypothetical protein LTR66_015563, partial [Elasticomyces elasticus]
MNDPRPRLPKKLIVCCDGTWMDSDDGWVEGKWGKSGHLQTPSNVTRIARAIRSEDDARHPQVVYYQAGVGTGITLADQFIGGGTGLGLSEHIREAYTFLATNYIDYDTDKTSQQDSIFLIGFSRGAFTARSLGGLIGALGLLRKPALRYFYMIFKDWENAGAKNSEPLFFDYYRKQSGVRLTKDFDSKLQSCIAKAHVATADNVPSVNEYLKSYRDLLWSLGLTQKVMIQCIGVWDTVGSLGIPVNPWVQKKLRLPTTVHEYKWLDTSIDNHAKNAFQALALDEQRAPFWPSLWEKPEGCTTNLKQVWFPGVHSNVGGGYDDTGLADITLAWMMDQLSGPCSSSANNDPLAFDPLAWIAFDEDHIASLAPPRPAPSAAPAWALGKIYNSLTFPQSLAGRTTRTP